MTTLNTIIEEEEKKAQELLADEGELISAPLLRRLLTTAMQRAYEAGQEERDTYWRERVRKEVGAEREKMMELLHLSFDTPITNEDNLK